MAHFKLYKPVFSLLLIMGFGIVNAQNAESAYMVRAYYDNDGINDLGEQLDRAYTSGEQVNLYYNINHKPRFFLDKWMPRAGDSSINTYSLGLMQMLYTPDNITTPYYVPDDYAYAGAIEGKHSLCSYNPVKKYDLQTELVFGIMGPAALAEQSQSWLHNVFDYETPGGWDNQYRNAPLLNINFNVEKEVYSYKGIEVTGNAQISAGTMLDELELGTTVYMGKMQPYFNGFMGHYSSVRSNAGKVQFYFMMKTAAKYVLYNAMLQGGLFTPQPRVKMQANNSESGVMYAVKPATTIENFVGYVNYGFVFVYGRLGISLTQTYLTPDLVNVYNDLYGNISLYYSW